jgi:hypothetical protein
MTRRRRADDVRTLFCRLLDLAGELQTALGRFLGVAAASALPWLRSSNLLGSLCELWTPVRAERDATVQDTSRASGRLC